MVEESLTRKEQEEENRKQYILDTAEKLFARKGYYATTVSDIAKEAEFGIGTLYKYYKDKESLFETLLNQRFDEYFNLIEAVLKKDDNPIRIIERVTDVYVEHITRRFDFFMIFNLQVHGHLHNGRYGNIDLSHSKTRMFELFAKLESVFTRAVERGYLRDFDTDHLTSGYYGILMSFFFHSMRRHDLNEPVDLEKSKRTIKAMFFEQMLINQENQD